MTEIRNIEVSTTASIRGTIKIIDANAMQIALVVDDDGKLVGTVTDGDVRRGILAGVSLEDAVSTVMNTDPTVCRQDEDRDAILARMRASRLHHMPVVDRDGRVVALETLDELITPRTRENSVVLMAGGLGTRLRPLTEDTPKPMLRVGGRPILETILLNCLLHGLRRFHISVNYKSDAIKDYFGDGSKWSVRIDYLEETERLGTAGALSLLPERPTRPVLVMNGDLLTKVNFAHLLDFHAANHALATMCIREFDLQVPYGVVRLEGHSIAEIEEKPVRRFFVNAGIYVLNPETLDFIPPRSRYDMPELFEEIRRRNMPAAAFPLREYWLDIGQMADFERASGDYAGVFSS